MLDTTDQTNTDYQNLIIAHNNLKAIISNINKSKKTAELEGKMKEILRNQQKKELRKSRLRTDVSSNLIWSDFQNDEIFCILQIVRNL